MRSARRRGGVVGAAAALLLAAGLSGCPRAESEGRGTQAGASDAPADAGATGRPDGEAGAQHVAPARAAAGSPPSRAGPPPAADDARITQARSRLEAQVRHFALADPDNSWALVHALLVLASDTPLPDGGTIADALLSRATVVEAGGRRIPAYAGTAADGTPREPHPNQVVRALLASGVSLERAFAVGDEGFKVVDLLEGALWRFQAPPDGNLAHEAWTLMALGEAVRRGRDAEFRNHRGQTFDGRALAQQSAEYLVAEMAFIEAARDRGVPLVKRREGVHGHPCGGFHTAQAPVVWLADEASAAALRPHLERSAATLAYRLGAERRIYEEMRARHPEHVLILTIQELKFYGHWLEVYADLRDAGVPVDGRTAEEGVALLVDTVLRLEALGAFDRMEEIRRARQQSWLDLIGDSAHALRGLRAWTD